jgi:nucleotide-binding universal stress UspA family protein
MALEESDLQLRRPQTAPAPTSLNADLQFHRVLVPLDGSALAEAVLPYVRRLASPRGTRVILLQVITPAPVVAAMETPAAAQIIAEAEERDRVEAQTYLDRMRGRLAADGLDVTPILMTGDPATIIHQLAREHEVELIAMTTHGRTGIGRLVFGSVAEQVIRSAPVPVFLVRVTGEAEARRAA